ncbi:MAG: ADP-ribosylglycohydrolase family protein [bacterium]
MKNLEYLYQLLKQEMVQRKEEGCDISGYEGKLEEAKGDEDKLLKLYEELSSLSSKPDFPYYEPSDWEELRNGLSFPSPLPLPQEETLNDKIYGAWLGRCAGCMLGKPVEGWSREKIKENLKRIREYPLTYYFPLEFFPEVNPYLKSITRGNIKRAVRDDDTDYTILNLHICETYGKNFTPLDVGKEWLEHFPYHLVYTAEREAYRNLVLGLEPPETSIFLNPFREWIGAQIRADAWGYVSAGNPALAFELAWRDAILSHRKNGIYGEIFFSVLISSVLAGLDLMEGIEMALSLIPPRSRFGEAVNFALALHKKEGNWERAIEIALEKYGDYHPVHTINNAVIVLLALLYGEGDFGKSICLSVMGGLDTDCNGATVGSVMGGILGASNLPEEWVEPLNDELESVLVGFQKNKISDLASRTLKLVYSFRADE